MFRARGAQTRAGFAGPLGCIASIQHARSLDTRGFSSLSQTRAAVRLAAGLLGTGATAAPLSRHSISASACGAADDPVRREALAPAVKVLSIEEAVALQRSSKSGGKANAVKRSSKSGGGANASGEASVFPSR
jgi:hypothetical protein